ncbi:acyl--CoA ligase [Plantactinospora mayteni]|uniref:AMP-dependent ligase n=1 Tax=Plantactinospora mayteni TaxID=566021 RepID=A0ABQ4EIC9_9ACTN|nr:class I adenylate-forming enzyme family protein [Plantactinospora mayteni]GIG94496.1 AMP-dependent ligase [Plantactinospora mayteni]
MTRDATPDRDWAEAHRYRDVPYDNGLDTYPTVLAALDDQARRQPTASCLTTVAPDGSRTTVTFVEARDLSERLAGWLARECGLRPGDVIGLQPANDLPSAMAILAVLRTRAVCLLLSPHDPAGRVRAQLESQQAVAVLRSPAVAGVAGIEAVELPAVRALPDARLRSDGPPEPTDDALLFSTSGSTTAAKVVAQSHRNAVTNAEAFRRHHRLEPGDRLLGFLPIYHVNGVHSTLLGPIVAGAQVILAHGLDPLGYPALLRSVRPRIASVVPSALEALLVTWRDGGLPPEFRYFLSAAAPLGAQTARDVYDQLGARIVQGYGLTETTNFATTMPPDLTEDDYRRLMLDTDIPPIGVALHGNEVSVRNSTGEPVPAGTVGEIQVRGHNVMSRYAGNSEATAQAFSGGWFHTGDLGMLRADPATGREYVVITGRIKNMAKVRGEAVSLEEMERVLQAHPGVVDAACVATPDRLAGEQILVALVAPEGVPSDLTDHLRQVFAEAALPRRVVLVEAVPRTPTGKIRRPELPDLLGS